MKEYESVLNAFNERVWKCSERFQWKSIVCIVYTLLSQWECLPSCPWDIRVAFPKESQLQQSRYPTPINYKVHAGSFRVSIIQRTLTWTTGSLTCVRNHSYACAYTRGLGIPTASQHNIFDSGKTLTIFFNCAPDTDGVRTSGLWISSPTLYQLSHPITFMTGMQLTGLFRWCPTESARVPMASYKISKFLCCKTYHSQSYPTTTSISCLSNNSTASFQATQHRHKQIWVKKELNEEICSSL